MKFNEIIAAGYAGLSKDQQDFVNLHKSIIANGNASAAYWLEAARGLKEMRDSGKFKTAGFQTFGEYAEAACGIKERQAYNYISTIEQLSPEFLHTNLSLGVSKLSLLASMSEIDRKDLIADHDGELDDISTRQLERFKKEYENRIQQMEFEFAEKLEEKDAQIDELGAVDYTSDLKRLEDEKERLAAEIRELKEAPEKADDKAEAELEKKKAEIKKLKDAKATAEKELEAERARVEKEIAAVTEAERAAVKVIEKDLELERARIAEQLKKVKIAEDPAVSEFKVKFQLWQGLGNDMLLLLEKMEKENAEKCKKAFTTVLGGWSK